MKSFFINAGFAVLGAILGTLFVVFNEQLLAPRSWSEGQPLVVATLLPIFAAFTLLGARRNIIRGWANNLNCHEDNAAALFYGLFGGLLGIAAIGLAYLPSKELGLMVKVLAVPMAVASYLLISSVVNLPTTADEENN